MRAAPTSWRHRRAKVQTKTICVSHVEKWDDWKPEMTREDDAAAEESD
jgi:hypothetical protein